MVTLALPWGSLFCHVDHLLAVRTLTLPWGPSPCHGDLHFAMETLTLWFPF